jgi:hypothetical protein
VTQTVALTRKIFASIVQSDARFVRSERVSGISGANIVGKCKARCRMSGLKPATLSLRFDPSLWPRVICSSDRYRDQHSLSQRGKNFLPGRAVFSW